MTTRPHDALFKAVFAVPEHAAALCRAVLPPEVLDVLDLDTLQPESASFVDSELADLHGDLLLGVALRATAATRPSERALVYVLVEHQSRADVDMPLRLLGYLVEIWRRERRADPARPLPLIIPIVLSHAPGRWTAPRSLRELFAPGPASDGPLAEFCPRFRILVEDLAILSNEDLAARIPALVPRLTWWLLRDARDGARLLANVVTWAADLEPTAQRAPQMLALLLRYLTLVTDPFSLEAIHAKLEHHAPRTAEAAMTAAESLIQKGLEQGLQQGLARVLRLQLVQRFGALTPVQQARVAAASIDELERAVERVLVAPSADAVLDL